ncbi:FliH/SctL family protein [Demequina salsinemoris]|uniref:FliH/SctL family protein n=1 Tax=Demequina salsinemoris TaxID=577470 RepID=UPI0007810209|nr:FliH/SctL family protein [Demequina salsinemoris]
MSLDARVAAFVPSAIAAPAADTNDAAKASGHAAGYAAGYAAGTRAAAAAAVTERARLTADHERREAQRDAAVRQTLAALTEAATQWERRSLPVLDDAEGALHQAALMLAEAVLARETVPGPGSARDALARALTLPDEVDATRVRLNPADLEHAQRVLSDGDVVLPEGVALVSDPRLNPGDAVTDYDGGELDARLSSALDRARRALLSEED